MSNFPSTVPVVSFLNVTNPLYSRFNCDLAEAMYTGGAAFDRLKNLLLDPRVADQTPGYRDSRLAIARYTDWIAGIFDNYVQTAFTNPPKLMFFIDKDADLPEQDAEEKLDYYNSLNDGLEDLAQGRNRDMILHGSGFFTVSFPDAELQPSLGLQKKLGALDAQLCYLSPSEIEDWSYDLLGDIEWVKTHQMQLVRTVAFGPCDTELHTWTYFTQTEKVVYQATKKVGKEWDEKKDFGKLVQQVSNGLGLPIFECRLADRICLFERVRTAALSVWNFESDWAFALKAQCYGQPWVSSKLSKTEIFGKGPGSANEFNVWHLGEGGSCGYLLPQGVAFDSIKDAVESGRQSLFTSCNAEALQIGEKDQHAASGEAKQQDRQPAEAIASAYARSLRCSICEAVDYIIAARKDEGVVTYQLLGLDNFNPITVASKIKNVTSYLALPGSPTAKRIALNDLDQTMAVNATPEEREQINEEKEELDVEPKPIAPPAPQGAEPDDDGDEEDDDQEDQKQDEVKK